MTKKNNWNLQEMQETLVKDTEQRISDGFQEIAEEQGGEKHQPSAIGHQPSDIRAGAHQGSADLHPDIAVHAAEQPEVDATEGHHARHPRCRSHRPLARRAGGKAEGVRNYINGHQRQTASMDTADYRSRCPQLHNWTPLYIIYIPLFFL